MLTISLLRSYSGTKQRFKSNVTNRISPSTKRQACRLLCDQQVSLRLKVLFYKTTVRSRFLFFFCLESNVEQSKNVMELKFVVDICTRRRMCGVTRKKRIRTVDI